MSGENINRLILATLIALLATVLLTSQESYDESFAALDQSPSRETAMLIVQVDQKFREWDRSLAKAQANSRDFCVGENCNRVKSFAGSLFPDEPVRTALSKIKSALILFFARLDHAWEMIFAAFMLLTAAVCDGISMRKIADVKAKGSSPKTSPVCLKSALIAIGTVPVAMFLAIPWFSALAGCLAIAAALLLASSIATRERNA